MIMMMRVVIMIMMMVIMMTRVVIMMMVISRPSNCNCATSQVSAGTRTHGPSSAQTKKQSTNQQADRPFWQNYAIANCEGMKCNLCGSSCRLAITSVYIGDGNGAT